MATMQTTCDFLVLGSGVAGLTFALEAATYGDVILVTKALARRIEHEVRAGRIAAVLAEGDSFESHIRDTIVAGAA